MALTGRLIALAALGLLVAAVSAAAALAFAGLIAAVVLVDALLAARIADLRLSREPSAAVRLGQQGETALGLVNGGRRRLRAIVRDAWVPSAGATPRLQPVDVRPGDRGRVATVLWPSRRGERAAAQVTVRSFGPLRVAARQRRIAVPGVLRVLPAFGSRRFLPEKLSRLRQIDGAVLVRQRGQHRVDERGLTGARPPCETGDA